MRILYSAKESGFGQVNLGVLKWNLTSYDSDGVAEVAERVGYGSASTFSTAFSRHVGRSPGRWARQE